MAKKNKPATTNTTNLPALKIGSRIRCTEDGVEGRIVWANAVAVKIKWDDGEQVTWKRDSLATKPIEIIDDDADASEPNTEQPTSQPTSEPLTAPTPGEPTPAQDQASTSEEPPTPGASVGRTDAGRTGAGIDPRGYACTSGTGPDRCTGARDATALGGRDQLECAGCVARLGDVPESHRHGDGGNARRRPGRRQGAVHHATYRSGTGGPHARSQPRGSRGGGATHLHHRRRDGGDAGQAEAPAEGRGGAEGEEAQRRGRRRASARGGRATDELQGNGRGDAREAVLGITGR